MILLYKAYLKDRARKLRTNMTDSERMLWSRLRGKQLLNVQFYRQKPIGDYIVDFYAPKTKLVVEVDGSQHMTQKETERDRHRDKFLGRLGLRVLRFSSKKVLEETDAVVEVIYVTVSQLLNKEIPPNPPLVKRGQSNHPPLSKGDQGGF